MNETDETAIKGWEEEGDDDIWLTHRLKLCSRPEGEKGVELAHSMNQDHSQLVDWGLNCFQPDSLRTPQTALDIGCGGGATLNKLHKICPKLQLSGIDYSADMVGLASRETAGFAKIGKGDVCDLPYHTQQFDLVTAVETLYFWKPLEKALTNIYRVLKEDGIFIVIHEIYEDRDNQKFTERNTRIKSLSDMHLFAPEELANILQTCGFRDVTYRTLPEKNWITYSATK